MIFAQQLFHKYRVKRKSQYTEEDKRITNELMDLWHEASGEENPTTSNYLYSDPQWNDEWYLVRHFKVFFFEDIFSLVPSSTGMPE